MVLARKVNPVCGGMCCARAAGGWRLWKIQSLKDACREHGGFYLGSIGGSAAKLALESIKKVEVQEYPELGMEAVWRIEVEKFPAFIVVDDKGNDFFTDL